MERRNFAVGSILVVGALFLSGCEQPIRGAAADGTTGQVAGTKIERIDGSEINRLTLTSKSAERLAIKTAPVAEQQVTRAGNTSLRKVIPYSSSFTTPAVTPGCTRTRSPLSM
jgi:hypothetical protein